MVQLCDAEPARCSCKITLRFFALDPSHLSRATKHSDKRSKPVYKNSADSFALLFQLYFIIPNNFLKMSPFYYIERWQTELSLDFNQCHEYVFYIKLSHVVFQLMLPCWNSTSNKKLPELKGLKLFRVIYQMDYLQQLLIKACHIWI